MLLFLLLTFALTWSLWFASAMLSAPAHEGLLGYRGPLFLLGVFAPGIVALALTASREGADRARQILARIGRWDVGLRYYVIAISYLAAVKLTAAVLHRLITGAWPVFGEASLVLIFGSIAISIWAQAGEEVGWRGFALPRLTAAMGLAPATLVLGVIWAAFHLPLFFMPGTGSDGQSFPLYLLHVTALSVVIGWLYWKTDGSLLLVMLMHASVNNTTQIVRTAVPGASDPLSFSASLAAWLTVAIAWLVALPCLYEMRGVRYLLKSRPAGTPPDVVA